MHPGSEAGTTPAAARGRSPTRHRWASLSLSLSPLPLLLMVALAPARAPAAVLLAQSGTDRPLSPQSERRRQLLEEMGLQKQDAPAPAPARSPAERPGQNDERDGNPEVTPASSPTDDGTRTAAARRTVLPAAPSFRRIVEPLLQQTCKTCHTGGGPAKMTTFLLTGEAAADHGVVMHLVDVRAPASSALLAKSSGQKPHGGGAPWPAGGAAYGRVLAWIRGGARLDGAAVSTPLPPMAAAVRPPEPPKKPRARATMSLVPAPVPSASGSKIVVAEAQATTAATTTTAPTTATTSPSAASIDFGTDVHPVLMHACAACHSPLGMAAPTRLILSGEVDSDYAKVSALVLIANPARSLLVTKAAGEVHGGAVVLVAGGPDSTLLVSWIAAGATRHAGSPGAGIPPASAEGTTAANGPPAAVSAGPHAPTPAAAASIRPVHGHDPGSPPSLPSSSLSLPYGLALDGRFDVAYERRGFSGDPTVSSAVNALRSYHHFLFLTRESSDDPIGLAVEITSLQFWEAHTRWRARSLPVEVVVAAGKLLVPFGADPLMHQSYGGLAGFDQRILPVIWAQTGVAVHALAHHRELALTDDLYVVRGYALRQADGIINLQNDFSAEDAVELGWGNRVGAAWGPLSGWYSTYYNALGFGRRLVMQAGDVMLSRVRPVPVLGHFSFAAGVLRADVSGGEATGVGGPGKDYYHFGSYFQVRYHPCDWFFLQYRQGLRTFNNRRGVFVDDTRLTSDDGSTHNFAAVARFGGVTAGLYYFINLEKVGELPDDFLRASLTYDF